MNQKLNRTTLIVLALALTGASIALFANRTPAPVALLPLECRTVEVGAVTIQLCVLNEEESTETETVTAEPTETDTPTLEPTATDTPTPTETETASLTATDTETPSATSTATETDTPTPTDTDTPSATATDTATATSTPSRTPTPGNATPFASAPLCLHGAASDPEHDTYKFHTLWDSANACHYDHEHGTNPFTAQVEAAFPDFDLRALLGGVEVSHTNPSSPMENTHKHGGNKWNVQLVHPQGCTPFEVPNGQTGWTGVNGSAIQFHAFGDPAIENEVRIHSSVALLRQCKPGNPTDYGYVFINQLQDYGQRILPYQGDIPAYPNQPIPAFPSERGPYWSNDCIGVKTGPLGQPGHKGECRSSLALAQNNDSNATVSSKVTGAGHSDTPNLFRLLWRSRDVYSMFLWSDQVHPFTFLFLCTSDGGAEYSPAGCKYTNTTPQAHEIAGVIPLAWDNVAGWDSDPRVGRVTVSGFVDQLGNRSTTCTEAGGNCYPIKTIAAFTGPYGSILAGKTITTVPYLPSRNICFNAAGAVVSCDASGAIPSGWIGKEN
jgi:hypothetical protein